MLINTAKSTAPEGPSHSGLDLEQTLNPAQRAAVTSLEGAFLVVAGAGSGKTRTLVFRVAHLVEQGVDPESILLLTFTRRAAQEMLRRAAALLDERCRRVSGGTFHSFANLVLRRWAPLVGFESGFTILDRADAGDLMGVLRTEAGFDRKGRRFARKDTLIDLFSRHVNTGRSVEALIEELYPQFVDDLDDILLLQRQYFERKRQQNVLDYDDLLTYLRDLLRDHESVRRQLSGSYRYLMVDEYQDTNRLQAHIAALLASGHGNLMVVGDDAQSIYSFRGASFRNIMDFPQLFPNTQTILLEQNYRSTQPILDLGNAILESAKEKHAKRLFSEIPGSAKPVFVRTPDEFSQGEWICRRILELREEGVELREIAILARAAWHTNNLELELRNHNIPFRKFGGIRFVEAAHVKDVCALLKLSLNPRDAAAWFRVLQLFEGIGPRTAQELARGVIADGGRLDSLSSRALARRRYGEDLRSLRALLENLARPDRPLTARLDLAIDYYRDLMPKKYDDAFRRVRDLEGLQTLAARYVRLEDFLTDIAIDPPEVGRPGSDSDPEDEWVTLSTIHSAKGLEWHSVFILKLTDGQFPSHRSFGDESAYEEERRLLYVAVTRARRNLYLLHPEQAPRRGPYGESLAEVSSLLTEIPGFRQLAEEHVDFGSASLRDRRGDDAPATDKALLDRIQGYFSN